MHFLIIGGSDAGISAGLRGVQAWQTETSHKQVIQACIDIFCRAHIEAIETAIARNYNVTRHQRIELRVATIVIGVAFALYCTLVARIFASRFWTGIIPVQIGCVFRG